MAFESGFSSFCNMAMYFLLGLGLSDCQIEQQPEQQLPAAPTANEEAMDLPKLGDELTDKQVNDFAKLAIKNIHTEYPNKPSNVMAGPESVQSPQQMHPAFFGCFDWHSSVHGHWMLVRLLKLYPDNEINSTVRKAG